MKTFFPDQIPLLITRKEHFEALASVACQEVFATLQPTEAMSIREVANEIGKSPASVGEQVGKLVDVGLVIMAGTRKRRSRTESLYAYKAVKNRLDLDKLDPEAIALFSKQFRSTLRLSERQQEAFQQARYIDSTVDLYAHYQWGNHYLSPDDSLKIREAITNLYELMTRLGEPDPEKRAGKDYVRVKLMSAMYPTVAESKKIIDGDS